ncbi:hypothetical protein [Parabacteroides goldsteinii]|uniref:hypothetical protein n=1 Tax=Parabacteroides goldsteinii TaxID=328812 RepID=UPI0034A2DDA2
MKLCLAIVLSMMDCHVEYAWVRPDIKSGVTSLLLVKHEVTPEKEVASPLYTKRIKG